MGTLLLVLLVLTVVAGIVALWLREKKHNQLQEAETVVKLAVEPEVITPFSEEKLVVQPPKRVRSNKKLVPPKKDYKTKPYKKEYNNVRKPNVKKLGKKKDG